MARRPACSVAVDGRIPHVLTLVVDAAQSGFAGLVAAIAYLVALSRPGKRIAVRATFVLPVAALLVFGTLFVLANPQLADFFAKYVDEAWRRIIQFLEHYADYLPEILVGIVVAGCTAALLRPLTRYLIVADEEASEAARSLDIVRASTPAPLYAAVYNMLLAVFALFAVYLAFEFATLWFREFPQGFHYSGYAHQGAAWLTLALALATAVLSWIFQGEVLDDDRLPRLRRLAWIWSAENLLLALSVYHRVYIYIEFNGMTRMRMIGLFGISTVLAGFALVIVKILNRHGFVWLVRGQLGALALAAFLYALTPVDAIVQSYNVRQILRTNPAPAVQITEHPVSDEGMLMLIPLLECDNAIVRDGVRAMFAERFVMEPPQKQPHWTAWQGSRSQWSEALDKTRGLWDEYRDGARRGSALARFKEYAYQWY